MNICDNYVNTHCEPINYCSTVNDYRPVQSMLLTRFATADCSDVWRTTNQDYGAFYYKSATQCCTPDSLKAKVHRRHSRFQDWISYQTKHPNSFSRRSKCSSNAGNIQRLFPSTRNDTVRITHQKRFLPNSTHTKYTCNKPYNQNSFSLCGEDGLITEYIVKKILEELRDVIAPDEYADVAECARLLVSEILSQDPFLYTNEIIERVVTIITTPLNCNMTSSTCTPCYSNVSTKLMHCCNPQTLDDNCQKQAEITITDGRLSPCPIRNSSVAANNSNETRPLSNVFEELANLENAISIVSDQFTKS